VTRRTRPGSAYVAIGYTRASTSTQDVSPLAQREAVERWAAAHGVRVVAWFEDLAVSGAAEIDERPGLLAALTALREHGAGVLAVAKRDRIARDVVIAATIERTAAASGARVISADGTGNGDSPADAFMRTVIDGASAYERALIRSRTRAALAMKKARGERVGTVPYGYRVSEDGRSLEVDDAEQAVLAEVRAMRAAGLSVRSIVAALAAKGLLSRKGKPFGLAQIHAMANRAA